MYGRGAGAWTVEGRAQSLHVLPRPSAHDRILIFVIVDEGVFVGGFSCVIQIFVDRSVADTQYRTDARRDEGKRQVRLK